MRSRYELTVIQADFNLFSFSIQDHGRQTLLERDGMFNVDDQINKFLPGTLCVPSIAVILTESA